MISLRNHTQPHALKPVTLKHSPQLCCPVAGSVCALWSSLLGRLPILTHAHYRLTTIPPPHLAAGIERMTGMLMMATQTRTQSFFMFTELVVGWGGHSKQLRGRESCMERVKFCQECMERTMEGGKEIMRKKKKKQVGELRRVSAIWRGGGEGREAGYEEPLLCRGGLQA